MSDLRDMALSTEAVMTSIKKNTVGIYANVRVPNGNIPLDLLAAKTGSRWTLAWASLEDPTVSTVTEVAMSSLKRNGAGVSIVVKLHPNDELSPLWNAEAGSGWMLAWLSLSDTDEPVEGDVAREQETAFRSAHALIDEIEFQIWCADTYGVQCDEKGAAHAIRQTCKIKDFAEIRDNHRKTRAFLEMRNQFVEDFKS